MYCYFIYIYLFYIAQPNTFFKKRHQCIHNLATLVTNILLKFIHVDPCHFNCHSEVH